MPKPVARLTSPAQLVASLPLSLGYLPTESLVVLCCHEPRGRVGLMMRVDLPEPDEEAARLADLARRVRLQRATRFVVAVYSEAPDDAAPDGGTLAWAGLVGRLQEQLGGLALTEAVLVRAGRFWSYLCREPGCCPPEGTRVDAARDCEPVSLLEVEQVLRGRAMVPDRAALEASLAGPSFLEEAVAVQRCELAATLLTDAIAEAGAERAGEASLQGWAEAVERFRSPPALLGDLEAAALAVSLSDVWVRDQLAATPPADVPVLLVLLEEVARRTPAPYDAAVCTLLAWLTYCEGGGSTVTIALERALRSDPEYSMAHLLEQALLAQVRPTRLRRLTRAAGGRQRPAC